MSENHYVVLVHGSFAGPRSGTAQWYEPKQNTFATKLAKRLQRGPLRGAVWRAEHGDAVGFSWSGKNDHDARLKAGEKLAEYVCRVCREDPAARVHLVGHSHGGNVILHSVKHYLDSLHVDGWRVARQVLKNLYDMGLDEREAILGAFESEGRSEIRADVESDEAFLAKLTSELKRAREKNPTGKQVVMTSSQHGETISVTDPGSEFSLLRDLNRWTGNLVKMQYQDFTQLIIRYWLTSRLTNRLGKQVFLGTTFLWKRWNTRRPGSVLRDLVFALVSDFPAYAVIFAVCSIVVFAMLALVSEFVLPFTLPPATPYWLIGLSIALAVGAALWNVISLNRRDVNLYFFSGHPFLRDTESYSREAALPYESLTIDSETLDETVLALWSGPLLYSALYRRIQAALDALTYPHVAEKAAGETDALFDGFRRGLGGIASLGRAVVITLTRRTLTRTIRSGLIKLVTSTATGLSLNELRGATLVPEHEIGVPLVFNEQRLSIAKEAAGPLLKSVSTASESRLGKSYGFLWSTRERARRVEASEYIPKLRNGLDDAKEDFEDLGEAFARTFEERSQDMVLVLEERLGELYQSVELTHSKFYLSSSVVARTAEHLEAGLAPTPGTVVAAQ